jgi:hypothetical protein
VACPLCGKQSPLGSFRTSEEDDIKVVELKGLGRGKGFAITLTESIFDYSEYDETVSKITTRAFEIIRILRDHEIISDDDIQEELGLE